MTDDDWDWALTLNLMAAVRTMRAALPHAGPAARRSIVTVSSVNAFLPDPAVIDYSAAKAALTNLCKSLSKEFGAAVRVNTISPGPVQTDLWLGADGVAASVAPGDRDDAGERRPAAAAAERRPAGSPGRKRSPTSSLFLASDRAANITGSDFVIDGGLITTL